MCQAWQIEPWQHVFHDAMHNGRPAHWDGGGGAPTGSAAELRSLLATL